MNFCQWGKLNHICRPRGLLLYAKGTTKSFVGLLGPMLLKDCLKVFKCTIPDWKESHILWLLLIARSLRIIERLFKISMNKWLLFKIPVWVALWCGVWEQRGHLASVDSFLSWPQVDEGQLAEQINSFPRIGLMLRYCLRMLAVTCHLGSQLTAGNQTSPRLTSFKLVLQVWQVAVSQFWIGIGTKQNKSLLIFY